MEGIGEYRRKARSGEMTAKRFDDERLLCGPTPCLTSFRGVALTRATLHHCRCLLRRRQSHVELRAASQATRSLRQSGGPLVFHAVFVHFENFALTLLLVALVA